MKNPVYRLIDAKGRVYLPKDLRETLDLEPGGIVKLTAEGGSLLVKKVHLIEVGDHSPEAMEAYIEAASSTLSCEKQIEIAAKLLAQARKERI